MRENVTHRIVDTKTKDIEFANKELSIIKDITKNKLAVELFERWEGISRKSDINLQRHRFEYSSVGEAIEEHEQRILKCIDSNTNEIKRLKEISKSLVELENNYTIYSFTVNYHDDAHRFVEGLINSGFVKVIEQINT